MEEIKLRILDKLLRTKELSFNDDIKIVMPKEKPPRRDIGCQSEISEQNFDSQVELCKRQNEAIQLLVNDLRVEKRMN